MAKYTPGAKATIALSNYNQSKFDTFFDECVCTPDAYNKKGEFTLRSVRMAIAYFENNIHDYLKWWHSD